MNWAALQQQGPPAFEAAAAAALGLGPEAAEEPGSAGAAPAALKLARVFLAFSEESEQQAVPMLPFSALPDALRAVGAPASAAECGQLMLYLALPPASALSSASFSAAARALLRFRQASVEEERLF